MVEKTFYVAKDGMMFESKEKCMMYETSNIFSAAKQYIHLMDCNGIAYSFNNWDEFENALSTSRTCYMNIDNGIDKNMLCSIEDFMKDYYGLYAHIPSHAGEYRWDEDEEEWISYEKDFEKFSYNWRHRRG